MVFRGLSRDPFEVVMNITPRLGWFLSAVAAFAIAPSVFAQSNPGTDPQAGNSGALALNMKTESAKVFGEIGWSRLSDIATDTKKMSDNDVRKYLKDHNEEHFLVVLETIDGMTDAAVKWIQKNPSFYPYSDMPFIERPVADPKMKDFVHSLGKAPDKLAVAINFGYYYGSNNGELYKSAIQSTLDRKEGGRLSIAAGTVNGLKNLWDSKSIELLERVITDTETDAKNLALRLSEKPVEQVMKDWYNRSKGDQFKGTLTAFWPGIIAVTRRDSTPPPNPSGG